MPKKEKRLTEHPRVISYFDDFEGYNPQGFLSNFYLESVAPAGLALGRCGHVQAETLGTVWHTGEHLFAGLKASTPREMRAVASLKNPGHAKGAGRKVHLRPDWEDVKYDVMVYVVMSKFRPGTNLAESLMATGDHLLVEGTHWGDRVWGIDLNAAHHPGRNWLGRTLMARRAELRLPDSVVKQLDGSFLLSFWPRMEKGVVGTWSQ